MENALLAADSLGMDCVQVFVKNQRQWTAPPPTEQGLAMWHEHLDSLTIAPVVAHAGYLINLAQPEDSAWQRSVDAFIDEIDRCELMRIPCIVIHPGGHMGSGDEQGIHRVIQAIDTVHQHRPKARAKILLETTAGQGTSLGWRFEHLGLIIRGLDSPRRVGVCLDTAHMFAAGYDYTTDQGYADFVKQLRRHVGLRRVRAIHINDSKKPLGSRVDRHDHIGKGHIGNQGLANILNEPAFDNLPMILETPKGKTPRGTDFDAINLRRLKRLIRS